MSEREIEQQTTDEDPYRYEFEEPPNDDDTNRPARRPATGATGWSKAAKRRAAQKYGRR